VPFGAVRRYPCRLVSIDYSTSMHFHGGNTGSNPVGDAIFPMSCGQDLCVTHTDMFMKHKPMAQSAVKDFPGLSYAFQIRHTNWHTGNRVAADSMRFD